MRRAVLVLAAPGRLLAALPIAALAVLALPLPHAAHAQEHGGHDHAGAGSPYAAYLDREIKALAPEALDALLAGEGMEMALPAELNGYPGPKHALEMAEPLELEAGQVAALEGVRDAMLEEARRLGAEIVRLERELDRAFAEGTVSEATLRETAAAVADARGRLRAAHLSAHLDTRRILSEGQTRRYEELRGYVP